MASTASTGFRGPAKRAAFGDVTNLTKNVGAGKDSVKMVKPYVGTLSQPSGPSTLDKENVSFVGKDVLSRPGQTSLPSALPKHEILVRPAAAAKRPATSPAEENRQPQTMEEEPTAADARLETRIEEMMGSRVPLAATRLQPRHHKSQPDLKARQQVLRRTQSRVIGRPEIIAEGDSDVEIPGEVALPSQAEENLELAELAAAVDVEIEEPQSAASEVLPEKTIAAYEAMLSMPANGKDNTLPVLSEPEEWDEDEEDYDDQDQAFTTAHSFRSRDQTTGVVTTVVQPRVTARVQRELEEAKLEVQRTRPFNDIEEENWDVSMVAEYGEEIFEYMRDLEVSCSPNPGRNSCADLALPSRFACCPTRTIWTCRLRYSGRCVLYSWTGWFKSTTAFASCLRHCSSPSTISTDSCRTRLCPLASCSWWAQPPSWLLPSTRRSTALRCKK